MSALVSMSDGVAAVAARETPSPAASIHAFALAADHAQRESASSTTADTRLAPTSSTYAADFPARIQLLIERAGGASALARCCGVTARTVRTWCDGRGDISRGRCLALARALRVSPMWLVTGEGCMSDGQAGLAPPADDARRHHQGVDAARLAAALQVLQSYIALAGGSLSTAQRAEAVAELYGLLAQPGPTDAGRLIAFHKLLAALLRSHQQAATA